MYQVGNNWVKKVGEEGTSSPFVSRLFFTILEFRDNLFLLGVDDRQKGAKQDQFNRQYRPLGHAMEATRDAAYDVRRLVSTHVVGVQNGRVIRFRERQYDILETIDVPLGRAIDQLIDQSVVATKTALQRMLRDTLGLDIGFFFQGEKAYAAGINKLRMQGENELAQYLQDVRGNWHSQLQGLRVLHEHDGWTLGGIEYAWVAPRAVTLTLPKVLDLPVNEFAVKTANRVLLFIENMLVFAIQRSWQLSQVASPPIFIAEIPRQYRNPDNPQRFKLAAKGLNLDNSEPWVLTYGDDPDFL